MLLLIGVDLSLRLFGVRRTRRWLLRAAREPPRPFDPAVETARAQRLAALTSVAARRFLWRRGTCLREALVVEHCLRRRGLPACLRMGARRSAAGGLDAHAWVELDGVALEQTPPYHSITGVDQRLR